MSVLLEVLVFLPLVAAVVIGVGAPARTTAIAVAAANLVISFLLASGYQTAQGGFQFTSDHTVLHDPKIQLAFGLDGLNLVMVLLTTIVTFAAIWSSPKHILKGSPGLFYASSLLISGGALGAFASTDVFFFYAFHELALIPTFLMIGLFGSGDRKGAAWTITIYLGLGSLVLLAGLAALVIHLGNGGMTFSMTELAQRAQAMAASGQTGPQAAIFCTLLVGFGVLISLFPFHSWAAEAYASAPTPTAMLHAGVLKKFGLYGLLRVALPLLPAGGQAHWVMNLLLWALLGNIIIVGLVTIAQRDLDKVLGNSSVMHMGYVFLGLAAWNQTGAGGAVVLMAAHGLSIALLFLLNGYVREKAGTLSLSRLGGLAKGAPLLGLLFGMASFASIGLPGFANFAGEVLIFFGAFKNSPANGALWLPAATIAALWGVVISSVYMLRAYRAVFKGEASTGIQIEDISGPVKWSALLLVVALLIVGFCPNLVLNLVKPALAFLPAVQG